MIPKTAPSFATIFTGRHPREHGVRSNFARLPTELPVLAEQLREAGYRTAAFVSNPALREKKGFARGFDHFELLREEQGVARVNRAFHAFAASDWTQPTFVWLHYIDPHGPYEPPEGMASLFLDDELAQAPDLVPGGYEVDEARPNKVLGAVPRYQQREDGELRVARYVARYDAEIRYVDHAFGRVLDLLRERDLYEQAAIVFTSDHGESLGEHDFYFEHGWFAYDPGLRVPLLIKTPGQREGRRVDAQVSNLDLHPTLLGLAGAGARAGETDGVDLLRRLPSDRDAILVESSDLYPEKFVGARSARWKYLRREHDGREELYDLVADPAESVNLAEREPEVRRGLAEFTARRRALLEARAIEPAPGEPDDPETLERLRALGYVE